MSILYQCATLDEKPTYQVSLKYTDYIFYCIASSMPVSAYVVIGPCNGRAEGYGGVEAVLERVDPAPEGTGGNCRVPGRCCTYS